MNIDIIDIDTIDSTTCRIDGVEFAKADCSVSAYEDKHALITAGETTFIASIGSAVNGRRPIGQTALLYAIAAAFSGGELLGSNAKLKPRHMPMQRQKRTETRKVMASPPSTTLTTSHTISNPLAWDAVSTSSSTAGAMAGSSFTYSRGGSISPAGANYPDFFFVQPDHIDFGSGTPGGLVYQISVHVNSSALEIFLKGRGGELLVKIDDEFISLTPQDIPNDGELYYYYIPFGSRATRRVDVIVYSNFFGGFFTGQNDTIVPAPVRGPRTIVMGDSFTDGTGADSGAFTWVTSFAEQIGWDDVWASGVGATGYLAAPDGKKTFRQRVQTDVIDHRPDVVVIAGGINDHELGASAVQAEAALLFAAIKAGLPNALLVVISPFWRKGAETIPTTLVAAKEALKTEAEAAGGIFLDLLEMPLPFGYVPQETTLAAAVGQFAGTVSISHAPAVGGTYKFTNGDRFRVKSVSGTGPYTVTLDDVVLNAHSSGEAVVQCGDCFWTGSGNVGATSGYGNSDLFVSADTTHPSQAGHDAIGVCVAGLFQLALAPN